MSNIEKKSGGDLTAAQTVEKFTELLNKEPNKKLIKQNRFANNANYIGISHVEMNMDKLFFGQWKLRLIGQPQILGNSVVVSVEVDFLHPVSGIWLTRSGVGATDVQTDPNGRAKAKALIKAVPTAKSLAFKNACKSIGKLFGRDLNRDDEGEFQRSAEYIQTIVNE